MRALYVFAALACGCIDEPSVELVEGPDASTSSTSSSTPPTPPTCDDRCAAAGGTCANDTCAFTCPGGAADCKKDIRCPSGTPCRVSCVGKEACEGKVECRDATGCTIECNGEKACKGGITCAGEQCAVTCTNGGCQEDDLRCCAAVCTLNGVHAECED